MSAPILETSNLSKSFGALIANDGISLTVPEGAILGIIGPNGSGKSTLFNVISGFYDLDEGSVRYNGRDVTGAEPAELAMQGLVRMFQISRPFQEMTVRENMLAVHTSTLRIGREKRERADEILELLEINHLADHKASDLSGGQEKLMSFGRILMLNPQCVLLDEPLAGINPALQKRLMEYISELNENGTTFVIIEHDMRLIDALTEHVIVLDHGKKIAEGSFEKVKNMDQVKEAYLAGGTDTDRSSLIN